MPISFQRARKQNVIEDVVNTSLKTVLDPVIGAENVDLTKIENNPEMQRLELSKCRHDVIYFVNNYVWTSDPRVQDQEKRNCLFNLWPRQIELAKWTMERRALNQIGLVEKSRDSGVSIWFGAYCLHGWLFEDGFQCSLNSYIEEKVDKLGDPSSLMEKVRNAIRMLPPWMKPKGLREDKHLLHRRLINPENGSLMIGEIGDQIGRGGRVAVAVVDEAAFLAHPEACESALSATAFVKFYISTPNGLGSWFYRKRNSLPPEQVFSFRWDHDPRKDEKWKQKILAEEGEIVFQREYNLNYAASIEGIFIPAQWVSAAVNLDLPEIGDTVIGFDVADEGDNFNSMCPRRGPKVLPLITWKGIDAFQSANIAARHAESLGATTVFYDCIGPGVTVKGAWNALAEDQDASSSLPFAAVPVTGGDRPSEHFVWPDGKTSRQKFVNVRAEMWWILRDRFQKTYEHVLYIGGDHDKGKLHPIEELISIPDDNVLISELSTPLISYNNAGKIQVESKVQMKSRNIRSPDRADSLAYAFYPKDQKRKFWFR